MLLGKILSVLTFGLYGTRGDDPPPPLFYGWFFNETVATSLEQLTAEMTTSMYDSDLNFQNRMNLWFAAAHFPTPDPLNFYTKPLDPNTQTRDPYFHITSKYCGGGPCPEYEAKVAPIINTTFETHLIGFIWSSRTFGIRVQLSPDQEKYFENEASPNPSSKSSARLPPSEATARADFSGLEFYDQDYSNLQPTLTTAHITLGCAPNVSAVVTGQDAADVLEFEQIFAKTDGDRKIEGYSRHEFVREEPEPNPGTWVFYEYIGIRPFYDSFAVYYPKQAIKTESRFEVYRVPPTSGVGRNGSVSLAVLIVMLIIGKFLS